MQAGWQPQPQYEARKEQQRAWQAQLAAQQAAADRQQPGLPPLPLKLQPPPPPPLQQPGGPLGEVWQKLRRKARGQQQQQWQGEQQQRWQWEQPPNLQVPGEASLPGQPRPPMARPGPAGVQHRRQNVLRIFEQQQQQQQWASECSQPQQAQAQQQHDHSEQRSQPQLLPHRREEPQQKQDWRGGDAADIAQQQSATAQGRQPQAPQVRRDADHQPPALRTQKPKWWQTQEKYCNVNI